jgi:hypothetical protein
MAVRFTVGTHRGAEAVRTQEGTVSVDVANCIEEVEVDEARACAVSTGTIELFLERILISIVDAVLMRSVCSSLTNTSY